MALHILSWLVLAVIVGGLALAWSKRFLAFGSLALINIIVHFLQWMSPRVWVPGHGLTNVVKYDLALKAQSASNGEPSIVLEMLGHMFLHSDFGHLIGNMLFLAVIGFYLEERIGHRRVVATYLATGVGAATFQLAASWDTAVWMVGASGAVFGLIGGLGAAYPQDKLRLPVPIGIVLFLPMKAWLAAIVFAIAQFVFLWIEVPGDNVAYWAHLGGLGVGILMGLFILRPPAVKDHDVTPLARYAANERARELLPKLEASVDESDVYTAWLERFAEVSTCPECGATPHVKGHHLKCSQCGTRSA